MSKKFEPTDCRWHLEGSSPQYNRMVARLLVNDRSALDYLVLRLLERMLYLREPHYPELGYDEYGLVPPDYTSFPYPAECEELIYLAAIFAGMLGSRGPHDKVVTGKPGRPPNAATPYLLSADDDNAEYQKHVKRLFRLELSHELGLDKDSRRWTYHDPRPCLSLDEVIGDKVGERMGELGDGYEISRADGIRNETVAAVDPARLLLARQADLQPIYDALGAAGRAIGWPWWWEADNRQPARALMDKHVTARRKLAEERPLWEPNVSRFVPESSVPKFVTDARGTRVAWKKANPLLKAGERALVRSKIRASVRGDYIPDPKPFRDYPRPQPGDVKEASVRREYELPVGRGRIRVLGRIRSYHQEQTVKEKGESARISRVGASCPTCKAFMTAPENMQHHNCLEYVLRKEFNLSATAIEALVRAAVHEGNKPVVGLLEEIKTLVGGRPVAEAERYLRDDATGSEQKRRRLKIV